MKSLIRIFSISVLICLSAVVLAQHGYKKPEFNRQDTLRGSITPERAWWQLTYYHLDVEIFPADSSLNGSVEIHYRVGETPAVNDWPLKMMVRPEFKKE